jgi:hypothetical protein
MLFYYRRPSVFSPAAEPSLSHFSCSFQGRAVSRLAPGSAMSGGGSLLAQEARVVATQKSNAILMTLKHAGSGISASINDSISGLHLDAAGQATGDNVADGSRRFN